MFVRTTICLSIILFALLLLPVQMSANTVREEPLHVFDPVLMAQGDARVAGARGYRSLWENPAAFALGPGSFTLINLQSWVHSNPTRALENLQLFFGDQDLEDESRLSRLEDQFADNGLGIGAAAGLGYVGGGLGLGLRWAADSYLFGNELPGGIRGTGTSELSFVGGLAFPIDAGPVRFAVGASVRPFVRVRALFDEDASEATLRSFLGVPSDVDGNYRDLTQTYNGFGFALNAGVLMEYRDFTLGVTGSHLGNTRLNYSKHSLDEVINSLSNGALPAEKREGDEGYVPLGQHVIPMRFDIGLMWAPRPWEVAHPTLHLELRDPFGTADPSGVPDRGFLARTHLGGELEIMRFFAVRAGLNQGRPTAGFGLRLFAFDLNMALYGREPWETAGSSSGAALEFGVRF